MTGWPAALDRFLQTDPRDVGCAEAMDLLTLAVATDDTAVHRELGVTYRDPAGTVREMIHGLYVAGRLTAKQVGTAAE